MSEWTVVTVIATLVGLCAGIIRPLISLNGTITRLTEIVRELEKNISEFSAKNSQAHGKLWERVGDQDDTLTNHEVRISIIETQGTK